MFKVGIVGCGGIGNAHANSWKAIDNVSIEFVCDLNQERAEAMVKKHGARAITDIADLPADLDCISVVTPPGAHYPVVKSLLERKFNVFCEKPLTMNVEEGRELEALAKQQGRLLGVGFKMRFEPIFVRARELLSEIGNLVQISTTKLQAFHPQPETAWVKKVGAMYELSVHDFDLITFITGLIPQQVVASRLEKRFGWEKEDAFAALVDYGNGVFAQLQGMYAVGSTFCFRDLSITFSGDKGYMRVERPDRIVVHTDTFHVESIPAAETGAFVLELTHFRDAVLGRCANTLTAASANEMTRLIEDIRAIAR